MRYGIESFSLSLLLAGTALASPAFWASAKAQEPSAPADPAASTPQGEIVVTARKREESLSTAPLSITAVGGEALVEQGASTLEQLSAGLPNVEIGRGPQTATINIRGIGSGVNRAFEQSVGMYIDGVYQARARQILQPLVDLERIEVLRGPQGTLFGKNTVAGAVNITTNVAQPGEPFAFEATGDYEPAFDTVRGTAFVSVPIGDTLGFRLAGRYEETSGYIRNLQRNTDEPATEVAFLRGSLAWEPSDTFQATARFSYTERDVEGSNYVIRVFDPALGAALPINSRIAATAALLTNPAFGASDGERIGRWENFTGNTAFAPNDFDDQRFLNGSLTLEWDIGNATITSVSGYSDMTYDLRHDIDFLPTNLLQNQETEDFRQFSQEIRVSVDDIGPFSAIYGAYYENQRLSILHSTLVDGTLGGVASRIVGIPTIFAANLPGVGVVTLPQIGRVTLFDQDTETFAVFGEVTWRLTDRLRADVGLRWSRDTKDVHKQVALFGSDPNQLAVLPTGVSTGVLGAPQTALLRAIMGSSFATFPSNQFLYRTESHLTPSVNIQYDVTDEIVAYASYSEGFKSGGFNFSADTSLPNGAPGPGTEFEDERVNAWEAGIKGRLFDNKLRASLAVFRADFNDLQVTSFQGTQFVVGNAAQVRSQGVEFEADVYAADWLTFGGAVSYLDSTYQRFQNASCTLAQSVTGGGARCTQNLSGRVTPFAPRWSGNVYADVSRPLTGDLVGAARVDVNFRSASFLDIDLDPNVRQSGYAKINGRLAVSTADDRWEFAVYGRNLTNRATYSFSVDAPLGAGAFMASIEERRTLGLQLRYRY